MPAPKLKLGPVLVEAVDMPARVMRERAQELRTVLAIKTVPPTGEEVAAVLALVQAIADVTGLKRTMEELELEITARNFKTALEFVTWSYFGPISEAAAAEGEAPEGEAASPPSSTSAGSSGS